MRFREKQGTGWLIRKVLALASIRLEISGYEQANLLTSDSVLMIDCSQTITGGLAGTTENRIMDWTWQDHSDYIFGSVKHRSRMIEGTSGPDGQVQPDFDLQTGVKNSRIKEFLQGHTLPDGSTSNGFVVESPCGNLSNQKDWWVHTFARNESPGWTAEQVNVFLFNHCYFDRDSLDLLKIWGFEIINGKRCHTRRTVVANREGKFVLARLVYSR
jgi:hypothetical protein